MSSGKITGDPSCWSSLMLPYGHAFTQSPQRVHRARKVGSGTAPGGRSQSRRAGTGARSAGASRCFTNSWAVLARDTTESFRKRRRPYTGSVAMVLAGSDHAVGAEFVDLDAPVAGPELGIPTRMILPDEVEHMLLDLLVQIFDPGVGRKTAERTGEPGHQHDCVLDLRNFPAVDL